MPSGARIASTLKKVAPPIVTALALLLAGCASEEPATPLGTGEDCRAALADQVTEERLEELGLVVRDPDAATIAVGGAIAEVCQNPPDTLEEGEDQVVEILRERNTSD